MALSVRCQCGHTYDLKDEYAGRLVRCPHCQTVARADRSAYTPTSQADPVFDRDVFLLRQKHLAINGTYTVSDESGAPLVFVDRPAHLLRNAIAVAAGTGAAMLAFGGASTTATALGTGLAADAVMLLGVVVAFAALVIVGSALSRKRDVTLYGDEQQRHRLLEILQDSKLQLLAATYTVRDAYGQPIARLRKELLANIFRRRWEIRTLADQVAFVATEVPLVLSLLRRVFGSVYGLLRTNFLFFGTDGRSVLGEFTRTLTILDRHVLDLRRDRHRKLDRRLALALGVMLDAGESR